MKKIWDSIAKDLWIVILDVIAVNAAYFLALLIRFYVNFEFRPTVSYLLGDWGRFAPFYTVLCIAVFAAFKLYGGMWRYAGINDMNRIIGACGVTTLIQILGTALFIRRMPISYYVIGAILQFFFLTAIRFSYRVLLVEKKKINSRKNPTIPALVIGAGETARKAMKQLEENTAFRAVAAVDEKSAGKSLDGVPVTADLDKALDSVKAVFIANSRLTEEKRQEIRKAAEARGIEVQDYSGYLSNLGGRIPLTALLELTRGPVTVKIDQKEQTFASGEETINALKTRYDIAAIEGLKLELKQPNAAPYIGYEAWAKQHKEETGEDVSFF